MFQKIIIILIISLSLQACSKNKKVEYDLESKKIDPYKLYQEGFNAFEQGDYFFANKKFSEAELNFEIVEYAAKSSIMSSYSLYGINFYDEALENLDRFIKKYPGDINIIYAHYLNAIIYYEQISDEKKDLNPLLLSKEKFKIVIDNYPNTDFAQDSKFKIDLINDILASKEMHIGIYYLKNKKWIAAINRFKYVVENYQTTIYIEEALHRLVETNYKIGLEDEAEKYANVLGYNYQSSEWYEKSYKLFNQDYKTVKKKKQNKKKNKLLDKIKSFF